MFKKLKEKIEEVKSSPQRIQQLTQSVTDKFQNSSVSEENFFSLGDEGLSRFQPLFVLKMMQITFRHKHTKSSFGARLYKCIINL